MYPVESVCRQVYQQVASLALFSVVVASCLRPATSTMFPLVLATSLFLPEQDDAGEIQGYLIS